MITTETKQNAHKIAYLVRAYPEKDMNEIIELLWMASVDINCAVWAAVELELITDSDEQTGFSKFLKEPEDGWDFGKDVEELANNIEYAFTKLNDQEKDLEENYLTTWVKGYSPHDTLIVVKYMKDTNRLFEYEIIDRQPFDGEEQENSYIFYTLPANAEKKWGSKQFRIDPLTGKIHEDAVFDNTPTDKKKARKEAREGEEVKSDSQADNGAAQDDQPSA